MLYEFNNYALKFLLAHSVDLFTKWSSCLRPSSHSPLENLFGAFPLYYTLIQN